MKVIALFLSLLFPPLSVIAAPVVFVATDDELNQALVAFDHEEIDSLAISQTFYFGSAKQIKDRILGLIAGLRDQSGKGIYLYGRSFDHAFAREQLVHEDGWGCRPAYLAGVIYGQHAKVETKICAAMSDPTETAMRTHIGEIDAGNRVQATDGDGVK